MKQIGLVTNILVILAAVAFVAGSVAVFVGPYLSLGPEGWWRGATGFLGFAIALLLIQIRDKA